MRKHAIANLYTPEYFRRNEERAEKPLFGVEIEHLKRLLALNPLDYVLDVGCATGTYMSHLSDATGCRNIIGVDPYCEAAFSVPGFEIMRANAESLPFDDGVFDKAYLAHVIGHLPRPVKAMRELRRVLKKDARVVIITPNRNHVMYMRPFNWFKIVKYIPDPTIIRYYSKGTLKALMQQAGFRMMETFTVAREQRTFLGFLFNIRLVGLFRKE